MPALRPLPCSLPCRRIPLEEVPEDEDECAAWLHRLYQEKVSAAGRRGPRTHPRAHAGARRALGAGGGGSLLPLGEVSQPSNPGADPLLSNRDKNVAKYFSKRRHRKNGAILWVRWAEREVPDPVALCVLLPLLPRQNILGAWCSPYKRPDPGPSGRVPCLSVAGTSKPHARSTLAG